MTHVGLMANKVLKPGQGVPLRDMFLRRVSGFLNACLLVAWLRAVLEHDDVTVMACFYKATFDRV